MKRTIEKRKKKREWEARNGIKHTQAHVHKYIS